MFQANVSESKTRVEEKWQMLHDKDQDSFIMTPPPTIFLLWYMDFQKDDLEVYPVIWA